MAESKETYRVETFGRLVIFTRQAIVNDDLDAFSTVLQRMALAAVQFENRTLVDLLTSNPQLEDGYTLFDNTHHHNLASAAALSVESIGAGRALMRLQQDLGSNEPMGFPPRYLVVPASLETDGEKLVTAIQATRAEDANPFSSRLEVVADPRLDGASALSWYLFTDPLLEPVIEYAYLEGFNGPFLETEQDFDTDGLKSKVRLDFGAGIVGHRGAVKNPGAEPGD
jgi:phage major head subunit gpT-like protein